MSLKLILQEIEGGDLKGALSKVQKTVPSKNDADFLFYRKILNSLVKCLNGIKDPQEAKSGLYGLASTCSEVLFSRKNSKIVETMIQVYHIHKFLLPVDPLLSKKLCVHYFKLKNESILINFGSKEDAIILNLITEYTNMIWNLPPEKSMGDDSKSAFYWIPHILKLFELHSYKRLSKLFRLFSKLLCDVWKNDKFYSNFAHRTYNLLIEFFANIKKRVAISENDCEDFFNYLGVSIFNRSNSASPESLDLIIKCVDGFIRVADKNFEGFALIKTFLRFFRHRDAEIRITLQNLNELLDKPYSASISSVASVICSLLSRSIATLAEDVALKPYFGETVVVFLSLARLTQINEYNRGTSDMVASLEAVRSILNRSFDVVPVLKDNFDRLMSLSDAYFTTHHNDTSNNALTSMVSFMRLYANKDLNSECGKLGTILVKYFLKNIIPDEAKLKLLRDFILRLLVESYGKIGRGVKVQMIIIMLASKYENLCEVAFHYWAKLKCMESSKIVKDQTVIDFVQKYAQIMEKHFPSFQAHNVDLDYFLLLEVKSYASISGIPQESVVSVADAALKIQNKTFYTLSLVYCVDIFASKFPQPEKIVKFEGLLHQCLDYFIKQLKSKNSCETNLLLGCVYYQLFRCELLDLQKKTENQLINLEVKNGKKQVLQADQDNEMDNTSFAPAYSYLQYEAHVPLLDKLSQAHDYWNYALKIFRKNDKIMDAILRQMEALALTYRLYKYWAKESAVWRLISEFGRKNQSWEFQVLGYAHLLPLRLEMDSAKVKEIKGKLEKDKNLVSPAVRYLFFLNLAKQTYHNNKLEESVEILKTLKNLILPNSFSLPFLEQRIFSAQCSLEKVRPEVLISTIKKTYFTLFHIIKNGLWGSHAQLCGFQSSLLDTAILLGRLFMKQKNVRYSRYFLKAQLNLAQRLAMPLRFCEFLTELGFTDMAVWNPIECDMKLKVVHDILLFDEKGFQVKEMLNPGSPCLKSKMRFMPHFLNSDDCFCLSCSNIDHQALTLNVITLSMLNLQSRGSDDIPELTQIGFKVIKHLKFDVSSHLEFYDYLVRFYNVIVRNYILEGNYEQAYLYNLKTMDVLACVKTNIAIDYVEPVFLKELIQWKKSYTKKENQKAKGRIRRDECYSGVVTPEKAIPKANPKLALSLKLPKKGLYTPTVKTKSRKLCFLDSPDSDDQTKPKLTVPKIKIYCDGEKTPKAKPQRSKNITSRIPKSEKKPKNVEKFDNVFDISDLFLSCDEDTFYECSPKKERKAKFSDLFGKSESSKNDLPNQMSSLSLYDHQIKKAQKMMDYETPLKKLESAQKTKFLPSLEKKSNEKSHLKINYHEISSDEEVPEQKIKAPQFKAALKSKKIPVRSQKVDILPKETSKSPEKPEFLVTKRVRRQFIDHETVSGLKKPKKPQKDETPELPKLKTDCKSIPETPQDVQIPRVLVEKQDFLNTPAAESDFSDKSIIDETPPEKTKLPKPKKIVRNPISKAEETPSGRITRATANTLRF